MRTLHCPRCSERLNLVGTSNVKIEKADGDLKLEIYTCPKCGKLEFFTAEVIKPAVERTNCSACGKTYDADFPRCPNCGNANPKFREKR